MKKITKKHIQKLLRKIHKPLRAVKKIPNIICLKRRAAFSERMHHKINKTFYLISNNCCGGMLYHDCKLRFESPTVNLSIPDEDYILFCSHLKEFVNGEIIETNNPDVNYPCGIINTKYGSVNIHFVHYSSFNEAVTAWRRRASRLDYNKVIVLFVAGANATERIIDAFGEIPFKKVLLTSGADTDRYTYCYNMKCYKKGYSGPLTFHKKKHGVSRYMYEFNLVDFVNESI